MYLNHPAIQTLLVLFSLSVALNGVFGQRHEFQIHGGSFIPATPFSTKYGSAIGWGYEQSIFFRPLRIQLEVRTGLIEAKDDLQQLIIKDRWLSSLVNLKYGINLSFDRYAINAIAGAGVNSSALQILNAHRLTIDEKNVTNPFWEVGLEFKVRFRRSVSLSLEHKIQLPMEANLNRYADFNIRSSKAWFHYTGITVSRPLSQRWAYSSMVSPRYFGGPYPSEPKKRSKAFPWPPPTPSTWHVLPPNFFTEASTLDDVDRILTNILKHERCNYVDKSYYEIPNGFALVTRLERINADATSQAPPERWQTTINRKKQRFSLKDYIKALFHTEPGYFRLIVFAITDQNFEFSETKPQKRTALSWLSNGQVVLPYAARSRAVSQKHYCTALIYEFEHAESGEVNLLIPSGHTGKEHLIKSNIWSAFLP